MDGTSKTKGALARVAVAAVMLLVAGCGIGGDDDAVTTGDGKGDGGQSSASTDEPAMRKPKSLCERVPHETVEGATRMELDPGNPSEADGQQCSWRKPGGSEAVTLNLREPVSVVEHKKSMEISDGKEIPDLGEHAYSTELGEVYVLTDEGTFRTLIFNFDVSDSVITDAGVTIITTAMETTEVPDTTTTTAPTTEPAEPTGLCKRVSIETVEKVSATLVEPGVGEDPSAAAAGRQECIFRERTSGPVVELELLEESDLEIVEGDPLVIDGTKAELVLSAFTLYLGVPEGLLTVRISNYELEDDEARSGLIQLAEEYLASE